VTEKRKRIAISGLTAAITLSRRHAVGKLCAFEPSAVRSRMAASWLPVEVTLSGHKRVLANGRYGVIRLVEDRPTAHLDDRRKVAEL